MSESLRAIARAAADKAFMDGDDVADAVAVAVLQYLIQQEAHFLTDQELQALIHQYSSPVTGSEEKK